MREFVVLLFFLATAAAATGDLVRCKRPFCDMACPYGRQKDSRGCEMCQCAEDPCKTFKCKKGEMCSVDSCSTPLCETPKPKCTVPCPMPMCAKMCDYGQKKDENGCETCNCKVNWCDGHVCPSGQKCKPTWEHCQQDASCWPKLKCEVVKAANNSKCVERMCHMLCAHGFQKDKNGCETCQCKNDVCDTEKCPDDQFCIARPLGAFQCFGAHCWKPSCTAKPLCHRQRDMHKTHVAAIGHIMHKPQCMKDGSFKPRQCSDTADVCWCVDDLGKEIKGTREVVTNMPKPLCYTKKSRMAHVKFHMKHKLPNIDHHLKHLKKEVHKKVTHWLVVQHTQIVELQVHSHSATEVLVEFDVVTDGFTDLASAVANFHYHMIMHKTVIILHGHTFTPDPHTLEVKHHYPEIVVEPPELTSGLRPQPTTFFEHHRPEIIASAVILFVMCLLVLLVAIKTTKDGRRRRRMFRENLAFANQLYHEVENEKKAEPVVYVEVEDTDKAQLEKNSTDA